MVSIIVFWLAIAIIGYTYLGFPLLTWLRAFWVQKPFKTGSLTPTISLIIAAYNEADVILDKLNNVAELDYPADKLELIVASDGSDDGTPDLVRSFTGRPVRLLDLPRQGKNTTLNQAVAAATGEILVMTDADSMMVPHALRQLIAPFADPTIGGVAGDYRYHKDMAEGLGEYEYWNFDRRLKKMQSSTGNVTSATGQIYAVRRHLFQPVPGGVTDDAYVSRSVIGQGYRLVFSPDAIAYGPIADADGEFRRKIRITTRGLNTVFQQNYLLNPFRYGYYAWQLLSHKVLRRMTAVPMILLGLATPFLWTRGVVYQLAALGQLALHSAALTGYLLRNRPLGRKKVLSIPFHFAMVHLATLRAVIRLMRGQSFDVWQAERGAEAVNPAEGTLS